MGHDVLPAVRGENGLVGPRRSVESDLLLHQPLVRRQSSALVSPTTTNVDVAYVKSTRLRPDFRMPSSVHGSTHSRRYLGLLNGWTCRPSQTSPATRHMYAFTPEMMIGIFGCAIGPGLKNGVMRSKR